MVTGHRSTLLNGLRAEISSAVPAWLKAMYFGQPTARRLAFSSATNTISQNQGAIEVPSALLKGPVDALFLRSAQNVDLYLPKGHVLRRDLAIPKTSLSKVDKIVALDTLQKTPFKPDEIYTAINVGATAGNTTAVSQWIVRRDSIAELQDRLKELGLRVRRIYVEAVKTQPLADFSSELSPRARFWQSLNLILLLTVLGLFASLYFRPAWQTSQMLREQKAENVDLGKEAVALRTSVEALRGSASERAAFVERITRRQTVSDTLRDVTVTLPDSTWVSDLQIQRDRIILRGVIAGSAAELLLDVSQSGRFLEPRLTGPISQTSEDHERFDMVLGQKRTVQ